MLLSLLERGLDDLGLPLLTTNPLQDAHLFPLGSTWPSELSQLGDAERERVRSKGAPNEHGPSAEEWRGSAGVTRGTDPIDPRDRGAAAGR